MADYEATEYGLCPSWALSLGYMGVAAGACLSNWGSAVSSFGVFVTGVRKNLSTGASRFATVTPVVFYRWNGYIGLDFCVIHLYLCAHFFNALPTLIPFTNYFVILGRMIMLNAMPQQNQNYSYML